MVAHADSDSLENFLLYVHTDYICVSQSFYVCGTSVNQDAFLGKP
jgi:hypothetical protein